MLYARYMNVNICSMQSGKPWRSSSRKAWIPCRHIPAGMAYLEAMRAWFKKRMNIVSPHSCWHCILECQAEWAQERCESHAATCVRA